MMASRFNELHVIMQMIGHEARALHARPSRRGNASRTVAKLRLLKIHSYVEAFNALSLPSFAVGVDTDFRIYLTDFRLTGVLPWTLVATVDFACANSSTGYKIVKDRFARNGPDTTYLRLV
jgi:hypothetical protein